MSVNNVYLVETAQGFLDDVAETQFGAVAATVGTVTTLAVSHWF